MVLKNELQHLAEKKLLILDIDGTLVRFTNLKELMNNVLTEIGIDYTDEKFNLYVKAVSEILKDSANEMLFNFVALCRYINHNKVLDDEQKTPTFLSKMITEEVDYVEECEGAKEFLQNAKRHYHIVCSTNWFESSQRSKLTRFDLMQHIDKIYTCENHISKPNTNHYLEVLSSEYTKPEEAIMIGDSITDLPDKSINLESILYDPNGQKQSLYEHATCVVTELKDIEEILKLQKTKKK